MLHGILHITIIGVGGETNEKTEDRTIKTTHGGMDEIRKEGAHIAESYKVVYQGCEVQAKLDIVSETIDFRTGDRVRYDENGNISKDHKTEWMTLL